MFPIHPPTGPFLLDTEMLGFTLQVRWYGVLILGGAMLAAWLAAIVVNLGIGAHFFDIALRDLGLMLSAITLGMLARHFDRRSVDEDDVEEREERRPMWRHRDDDVITR